MSWIDPLLDRLAEKPTGGYNSSDTPAVEPTALAAIALAAHGRVEPARRALEWLMEIQASDGSLGIRASQSNPHWATGWAVMAWQLAVPPLAETVHRPPVCEPADGSSSGPASSSWAGAARRGLAWLLAWKGEAQQASPELGHNTALQGWSWVEGTHSWVEPTAINLWALKTGGRAAHPRSREAVRLLLDRMLPSGGWNYGNTAVLGTTLRPHVQPTGLALAALAGEEEAAAACEQAVRTLSAMISAKTTAASLAYALIGMAGHGTWPPGADAWLAAAGQRALDRNASGYTLALLALASRGSQCPWFQRGRSSVGANAVVGGSSAASPIRTNLRTERWNPPRHQIAAVEE